MTNVYCRLCNGTCQKLFDKEVMFQHLVGYYECGKCDSLQTEDPYWLEEAYSESNLAAIDTFAANRVISNAALTWTVAQIFSASEKILDYGGGDGLLVRLLRDQGMNAYVFDRYGKPNYALTFDGKLEKGYQTVTAFEVLEHLPHPAQLFEEIASVEPQIFLVSTSLYARQGSDWSYLAPEAGTHVFFYSHKAIGWIAKRWGWHVTIKPRFIVFHKQTLSTPQKLALSALNGPMVRLLAGLLCILPRKGHFRDQESIKARWKA